MRFANPPSSHVAAAETLTRVAHIGVHLFGMVLSSAGLKVGLHLAGARTGWFDARGADDVGACLSLVAYSLLLERMLRPYLPVLLPSSSSSAARSGSRSPPDVIHPRAMLVHRPSSSSSSAADSENDDDADEEEELLEILPRRRRRMASCDDI